MNAVEANMIVASRLRAFYGLGNTAPPVDAMEYWVSRVIGGLTEINFSNTLARHKNNIIQAFAMAGRGAVNSVDLMRYTILLERGGSLNSLLNRQPAKPAPVAPSPIPVPIKPVTPTPSPIPVPIKPVTPAPSQVVVTEKNIKDILVNFHNYNVAYKKTWEQNIQGHLDWTKGVNNQNAKANAVRAKYAESINYSATVATNDAIRLGVIPALSVPAPQPRQSPIPDTPPPVIYIKPPVTPPPVIYIKPPVSPIIPPVTPTIPGPPVSDLPPAASSAGFSLNIGKILIVGAFLWFAYQMLIKGKRVF